MSKLIQTVYELCELQLGTPTEETRGLIIWDTDNGKVVFQNAVLVETDTFAANIFVGDRVTSVTVILNWHSHLLAFGLIWFAIWWLFCVFENET
jgi:hypothetical protein